ncbi:peptidoglycan DD-metalloendopeptidase family protein [Dysgonomonas sp. HDW5B]|uniref:murein hydrolase activator EnvC family protein n=1 Tax=Dysgonomonas sp. HDW5B TaxID=2714927 RepID=UPI00140790D0|nr:peptidoglycan DD-metalloendopeptidase family protein [Dysgonomonas sp. HDW5B]QIK53866.1 peptidoglycan DD-metalloendopeptidase family protein [Dysgonomonas sp. HDW5B]
MRSVLVLFILFLSTLFVFPQSNKIKDLENKRKLALREIESTTLLLNETKKNTSTLLSRINLLTEQISSRQRLISLLNDEMSAIAEQEAATEKEIVILTANLKGQQKSYARAVEGIVLRKQSGNKLLFVLSGSSLAESLRRMKYLKDYSQWRDNQITEIKEKQKLLQEKKAALEKSKAEKKALLGNREKEQTNLQKEEQVHKQEVSDASKKQKELQGILQTKQKQADNLNAQIEKLIAQEVARQEREAQRLAEEQARRERLKRERAERAEKAKREAARAAKVPPKTESPKEKEVSPKVETEAPSRETEEVAMATPTVTAENFKLSSNFAANKGRLPMPVTGSYSIVGRFGTQQNSRWRVTTNSNGIDIQARAGAQARAVFGGEVSRVVAFPGFNNCIIIRHGGYYSFYGNIQQIFVKQGQKISAGQALGTVYTDSDTGNSQLHFQLWQGTTKLNPEPWLQK